MFADYVLTYPNGKAVALVTAPVAEADRAQVEKEILENEPSCEQLGFVEFLDENSISLELTGGEFSDAVAASAAYLAEAYNMPVYEDMYVNVYFEGQVEPLSVNVLRKKDRVAEHHNFTCIATLTHSDGTSEKLSIEVDI